ncbi:MAG: extracellular solute-binding protein, partial [Geodermatophilaceae bacterium]|nr:extracellular solute-binding protein [Geodermatophilaceae bacterium]
MRYQGAGQVPGALRERLEQGVTPDVILLPVPDWLGELASAGAIAPLDEAVAAEVQQHFGPAWVELVSHDDDLYGVPLDVNVKSLLWYRPTALAEVYQSPPDSLEALFSVAAALEAQGERAFAVPGGAGWPLTDWFESLLLATGGAPLYDDLAARRVAWTDPQVAAAAQRFVSLLRPEWV